MIKTALTLIISHSLVVQLAAYGTISETTAFVIYALTGAFVIFNYIHACIETYGIRSANEETTAAYFYAGECLLVFFVACAHPYFYIAESYNGFWEPNLSWFTASPSWFWIPRSAIEWVQLLYSIPLHGLLLLALFFIMRTFCLLVLDVNSQAGQNNPPLQREVFDLKNQLQILKQQQSAFMRKHTGNPLYFGVV